MSEIIDIQVNVQKEKTIRGSRKLPQAHKKVCDENETNKQTNKEEEKRRARRNVIDGRKPFIRHTQRTGENDLNKLRVNNS